MTQIAPAGSLQDAMATAPPRVKATAWWALAVLMSFYCLSIVDRQIISLLVQPIKQDLQLTDTQMSLILGPAFFLSFAIAGFPAGWIADRITRRGVLFAGVIIWTMAATGGGLAAGFVALLLCRCFIGIGEAGLSPPAYSLLADHFPRQRLGFAIGIYQSSLNFGSAIAFGLGAYLLLNVQEIVEGVPWLQGLASWRLVLILVAAPGFLLAWLIFTVKDQRTTQKDNPAKEGTNVSELISFVRSNVVLLILLSVGFGCITATSGALTAWTPAYVEREFGWGPARSGPWLGVLSLATSIALICKGAIIDWLYSRGMPDAHVRFYTWLTIGSLPIVFALFWIPSPSLFLVAYGVLQILTLTFMVFLVPAIQIFTPPRLRGQIMALFLLVFSIFGSFGPVAVGVITDYVFGDEQRLGNSLAIVATTLILACIIHLRLSLPRLRALMVRSAEQNQDAQ